MPYRPRRAQNQMLPGVSCDRCGTPQPVSRLYKQDGYRRCPACHKRHGFEALEQIEGAYPSAEPLKTTFGGGSAKSGTGRRSY